MSFRSFITFVSRYILCVLFLKMSLEQFRTNFKVLHQNWGYRFNTNPNYEDRTQGDLRPFQHLTDYLMRYLQQGFVTESDVRTMFGVDFYKSGRAFNVSNAALRTYLEQCGPFFPANRDTCKSAYAYLKSCDPSSTRCLLQVSLRWTAVVRKYVEKLNLGKEISISSFTTRIKKATLKECRSYLRKEHDAKLRAKNVEDAIREVQEFDPDTTESHTSEGTSDDEVVQVIDLTNELKLRL